MAAPITGIPFELNWISDRNPKAEDLSPSSKSVAQLRFRHAPMAWSALASEPGCVERTVLVVDEAGGVRSALALALRRPNLEVLTSSSAAHAMAVLANSPVDIVIVDEALAGTRGVELLERVRRRYPHVKRALLTGHCDFSSVREAINRAGVALFLSKPWEQRTLQQLVENLLEEHDHDESGHDPLRFADPVTEAERSPLASIADPIELASRVYQRLNSCDQPGQVLSALASEVGRLDASAQSWWVDIESQRLIVLDALGQTVSDDSIEDLDEARSELVDRALSAPNVARIDGAPELLVAPVRMGDRRLGVLAFANDGIAFSDAWLATARSVAEPFASAIDRTRLCGELRDAERRADARRVTAVGHLAAGVAHEIRNPLAAMMNAVSLLRPTAEEGSEERELVDIVLEESRRVNRIVGDFLSFARPVETGGGPTKTDVLIASTAKLVRKDPRFSDGIELRLDVDSDLPQLDADADRIRQVLWNLLLNAGQAVSGRGVVVIGARAERRSDSTGVQLFVEDSGPGIPEDRRERVFVPFETSKPNGTGLGLSLAKHIVESHGGSIRVEESSWGGARLCISLPGVTDSAHGGVGPDRAEDSRS